MLICLKSWGIFNDEEEEAEKQAKLNITPEENAFFIKEVI
jgi:hypothetical protein